MSFIRQTLFRQVRTFSSTPVAYKTLTESVKDTAAAINQKVGQAAASGIQTARTSLNSIPTSSIKYLKGKLTKS